METLENYLEKLQSMIDSQVADPEALVKDLKTLCVSEISQDEQDLCSSLLFTSDNNILKFLKKSVPNQDKDYVKTREGLLLFIAEYIKVIGKKVQEYALDIKDTCFSLFRREQSNLVRIASFKPLIKLLELKLQLLDPERLAIREMTEIYLREFTGSKASQTVKALILELLGIFCENFPQYMIDKSKHILLIIMDSLHKQFKSKKPDMQIIAGAFKGLRSFLVNFSSELSSDNKSIASVYQYLCLTLEPPPHLVRYNIPKAGLKFLSTHAELIREYLTEDSEKMYARIIVFCKHQNSGVRSAAFPALDAFFTKVSAELTKGARSQVADQDTFKFFMRKFHDISESQSSSMYEITISILGYGRFASSIQQFLGFWELKKLLGKLFQFTDRMSSGVDQIDISSHLGGFISSFADIILQLDTLEDTHIENLEKILGAVFMVYSRLSYNQRHLYHAAISRLFIALYSKGSSLQVLLSRIVLQGLLLSCSKPFIESNNSNNTSEFHLWEQYLELWKQLLNPIQLPELQLDESRCKEIASVVYNELVQAIIQLIQKLDLSYTTEQNNEVVKPKNAKDFDIFLNLVDFVKALLLSTHQEFFLKWVYLFSKELIIKSSEHPLVSGFYKLLTVALRICEKQSFFDKLSLNQATSTEESEDMQTEEKEQLDEINSSYVLFNKFHREVLGRLEQYKDELLASCIEFVLSVPKQFIELSRLIPAIQTAFKIGLTYLPLAKIGLSALEYWIRVLPKNKVNSHLHLILPSLNDYLLISIQPLNTLKTETVTKKSRYSKKAKQTLDPQEVYNRSAAKVQFRIIRLLGRLGGDNYNLVPDLNLSNSSQKSESTAVSTHESISMAWDNVKRLKFAVPFKDIKPDIYFDVFLPRVVELAEGSNDRSIKIAACELLHSLVLYMIGISSSRDSSSTTPLKKIYDHVFPSLIRLATDIDAVTKQIFEPLLFQLIHWFTKNSKYENEETMSLLDAIVSSANSSEGSKRDFSAKCIAEFLKWSLKHSSTKQQEKNPFNAKSLFKRLYSLSKHPNPYKRLSAALSFEQIYRVFREEDPLVEQFTLEILHNLILSLRLCNQDDPSIGSADKITSVIRSYSRIIAVKSNLLIQSNSKRRGYSSLGEFVEWLFSEIGRHENRSRAECMSLISLFVPLLPQTKSLAHWIQQKVSTEGIDGIVSRIESSDIKTIDSSKLTNVALHLDKLNHWFQSMVTSLDCYIWLFQESLVAPNLVFQSKSQLLEHLQLFSNKVALLNKTGKEFKHLTPRESEVYHRNKSTVLLGLIKFVLLIMEKYTPSLIESILSKHFFEIVVLSLISPLQLGFSANDSEELKYLHSTIVNLIKLSINKLDKDSLKVFSGVLQKVLAREDFNLFAISADQTRLSIQDVSFLIKGYQQLNHLSLLLPNYVQSSVLAETLLDNVFDNAPKYSASPVQFSVAADLLSLVFDISVPPQHLLNCLLDVTVIDTTKKVAIPSAPSVGVSLGTLDSDNISNSMEVESSTSEENKNSSTSKSAFSLKNPTKGEIFYTTFKTQINAHLIKEMTVYAKHLLSSMHKHQFVFSILLSMIEELSKSFASKPNVIKQFLQHLFLYSSQLSGWCKEDSTQLQKANMLELLRRLIQLDVNLIKSTTEGVSFIYNSFNAFMARSIPLPFKVSVLSLLPFLLSLSSGPSEELQTRLNELVIFDFPTNSKDLPKGTSIYTDYCNAIEKLLLALEATSSLTVLQALFPILREQDHIYEQNINLALSKFIQKVDDHKGKDAFEVSFHGFLAKEHQDELRLALITKLCVPLIQKLSVDVLVQILSEKLVQFTQILSHEQYFSDLGERKTFMMEKMGIFKLIEIFYKRIPSAVIKDRLNKIYYDKPDAKGNELTTFLMKNAHQAKSEQIPLDEEHLTREFCLQYHSSAYNALASVILATQTKENFFTIFLFKESLEKNEKLWDNIVDTQATISFPVETKFPVARKIVESFRVVESHELANPTKNMQYLSSQYLADSSLSQDVSQSTFFKATTPKVPAAITNVATTDNVTTNEEEIELDEYNSNICMMTVLQIIDHLQSKFGATYDKQEMPKWMFELHTKFTTTTSPNVILFILKIVINKSDVFLPYAQYWVKPILRNVVSGVVGDKFNYFLRDICILLLKWNVVSKDSSEEKQLYSQFMNHIMKNCAYHDREIVKSNLTLFKLFTEKWKGKFTPSKKLLLDMLTAEATGKTNNLTHLVGIQLLDVILMNGYSLYDADRDHEVSEFKLLTSLVNNLSFPAKEVYCAAAALCGLALKNVENDPEKENILAQMLRDKITYFFGKTEYDRALNCLWHIGSRFPEFLQLFYLRVFSILPSLVGQFKGVALDLILLNANDIPDLFDRMKPELESIVQHHDPSQSVVLKILMSLLNQKKIPDTQISGLYQSLSSTFSNHSNIECRSIYYDILIWIYENSASMKKNSALLASLLKGLIDDQESISIKLYQFWDKHLPQETLARLLQVLGSLYSTETESHWVHYTTSLILELTHKSTDFDRTLFEPLDEGEFKEMHIDTTKTISSSIAMDVDSTSFTQATGIGGGIRATQASEFSLLQQPSSDSIYSSMVIDPSITSENLRQNAVVTIPYVPPTSLSVGNSNMPSSLTGLKLRRRFEPIQTMSKSSMYKEMAIKKRKDVTTKSKQSRSNQVTIYRKYRAGELPDIQIKFKDILVPLESLIKKDSTLAKLVFTNLFQCIYSTLTEREKSSVEQSIQEYLAKLLGSSNGTSTPFVAALLSIAIDNPQFITVPEIIGSTSAKSFNFHTGIILLERMILYLNNLEANKKKKLSKDEKQHIWSQLAKLYRKIGEDDILRGIFEKELAKHPYTKEALSLELKGDYNEAFTIYEKAIQELDAGVSWTVAPTPFEEEQWETARLECLLNLTRWQDLAENTLAHVDNNTGELWKDNLIDPYLSYYVQSNIRLKDRWSDLWEFLDMSTTEHKDLLEKKFAAELAFVSIIRNDLGKSRYYVNKFYEFFLADWSKLHGYDTAGKHMKLQSLQRVVELEEFLTFVANEKNFNSLQPLEHLLSSWHPRYPSSQLDNIVVWDNIVTYRAVLLEKLNDRYNLYWSPKEESSSQLPQVNLGNLKSQLIDERANIYRQMATAARKQYNFFVADSYLKLSLKAMTKKKEFMFPFFHSLVKLYCVKAKASTDSIQNKMEKYVKAFKFTDGKRDEPIIAERVDYNRKYMLVLADIYQQLATISRDYPDSLLESLEQNSLEHLMAPKKVLTEHLFTKAFESFETAMQLSKVNSSLISPKSASKSYLDFGLFCDHLLRLQEEGEFKPQSDTLDTNSLACIVIKCILESMLYNSAKARDRFPRLLEILAKNKNEETKQTFITSVAKVPSWMFLPWLAQILGSMNQPYEANLVLPILVQVAKSYPQALYYPFKITSESLSDAALKLVKPIAAELSKNTLLDTFVASLDKMTQPEHRFKDTMESLKPLMRASKRETSKIKSIIKGLYEDVLDKSAAAGQYNIKFANTWEKSILESFGKEGNLLLNMENDSFLSLVADFNVNMSKSLSSIKTSKWKLSDFSGWLSDYDHSDQLSADVMEIPGQYTGLSKPIPDTHIKITSFDAMILIMGSLRKPKRLKIHGNDERDYPFLVKGGEDLRLDQRVQQLFSVMNQILLQDNASAKRNLKIKTYQVVPMTTKVGMIQWLENTKPLKEIIEEELSKHEGKKSEILKGSAAALFDSWIKSFANRIKGKSKGPCELFYAMYQYASRPEVEKQIGKQQNSLPHDLLQRGIASLSSSPETYLFIRSQFAKTLAVFNIASYIVGIGDRHLENFLLDMNSGSLIGIDFGHAFGTATQFLPIPELIPFRLTRQLTQFLHPLDSDGLLKHNMIYTLSALQENQEVLLNTMDVFIKEPLLDWEKLARRVARDQGGEEQENPTAWFPKKKIDVVKRKLQKTNPAYITYAELQEKSVHSNAPYLKHLQQIVLGDASVNIRARVKEKCSSTMEQVECLIDQATDPNILGRTYNGWAPWV